MTIGVWRGPNRKYVGGVVELWSCSMKSNILYTVYKSANLLIKKNRLNVQELTYFRLYALVIDAIACILISNWSRSLQAFTVVGRSYRSA
jgi:hypothetical protein